MKKIIYFLSLAIFIVLALFYSSTGTDYSVRVKRIAQDLYKIEGNNIYIKTRYCHEYSYGDEAILSCCSYGYSKGKIFFKRNKRSYDIEELYQGIEPDWGTIGVSGSSLYELDLILVPTSL